MTRPDLPRTLGELAAAARARVADPREGPILVTGALGLDRTVLYAHPERPVTVDRAAAVIALIERRAAGEPVAYLLGRREFYGLDFAVGPGVLIPRPETELLVELSLERLAGVRAPLVADLGTGSGAIAVSVAHARPDASVAAVDCSADALAVAAGNAARLGAAVEFVRGEWLTPLAPRRFDVIVSNPPYVAERDPHLSTGDPRFEPRGALAAGLDGLDALRRIIAEAPAYLRPGGWLVLEHGAEQQPALLKQLTDAGLVEVSGHRDLAGLPRAATARRPPPDRN